RDLSRRRSRAAWGRPGARSRRSHVRTGRARAPGIWYIAAMQDAIAPALRLHDRLVAPRIFWSYAIDGTTVTISQGRVGTNGKSTTKSLESEDAARAFARKSLEQMVAKGFFDASLRYELAAWEDIAS